MYIFLWGINIIMCEEYFIYSLYWINGGYFEWLENVLWNVRKKYLKFFFKNGCL